MTRQRLASVNGRMRVPQARVTVERFDAAHGPASGSDRLDVVDEAFSGALGPLAALAAEETAIRRLRGALAEEECGDAVRRRLWATRPA